MGLHDNLRGASWTSIKVSMESPTRYGVRRQLSFSLEKTPHVNFHNYFEKVIIFNSGLSTLKVTTIIHSDLFYNFSGVSRFNAALHTAYSAPYSIFNILLTFYAKKGASWFVKRCKRVWDERI